MADAGRFGRWAAAGLLALALAGPARAASFGDVDVIVEAEPKGSSVHGYCEVWVRVANRSAQATREVRLTLPKSSYSLGGSDYLRAVTRTVTVEPGKVARVALAFPERHPIGGGGLGVAIDGSTQEDVVPVSLSSRGYSSYGSSPRPLVLYSRAVDTRFPDWMTGTTPVVPEPFDPTAPGAPGGPPTPPPAPPPPTPRSTAATFRSPSPPHGASGPTFAPPTAPAEFVRADQPVAAWSPNWLGYSRYDGIVLTADDLRTMPAEVRSVIGQYVECGGSLLVLGKDAPLPGHWKLSPIGRTFSVCTAGFGLCLTTDRTDLSAGSSALLSAVGNSWNQTLAPWQKTRSPGEANTAFPVVDDIGVPVQGLLALMVLFAVAIGPVNLYVLARRKRKLWLFWTVPLISLVTCVGVFGSMALSEGSAGRSRVEGFTVLDENTRRASSLGWAAFYTPLLPGGGLHFSPDTEVSYQNGDDTHSYRRRRGGSSPLSIDWGGDQHLASGWLVPRVPSHFVVRKGEPRRERVTVAAGPGGQPEAVNGLGADLTDLWYADAAGKLFHAQNVPAGGRATMTPAAKPFGAGIATTLRAVYGGDWAKLAERLPREGPALLTPRTYLAVIDGAAPFLDDGMPGAAVRKRRSVVFGIMREGGDEG